MKRKRLLRRSANWFALACSVYLGLAYFAAPEFWTLRERNAGASKLEMVTRTPQGIAGDPINVGLIGTREQIVRAFALVHWDTADAITLRTAVEIGESVLFDRPYPDAPVSQLLYEGRAQDLAFEKPVGDSADQRHHVRLWQTAEIQDDGRPLWLGAASFDRGVGISHDTGAITHHIGPDIDAERNLLMRDLMDVSALTSTSEKEGVGATSTGRNGGGDPYFTDGKVIVGTLKP